MSYIRGGGRGSNSQLGEPPSVGGGGGGGGVGEPPSVGLPPPPPPLPGSYLSPELHGDDIKGDQAEQPCQTLLNVGQVSFVHDSNIAGISFNKQKEFLEFAVMTQRCPRRSPYLT